MNKHYTSEEAAEILGISRRSLKYYRSVFTQDVMKETDGRLYFSQRFIDKVSRIRELDKTKFTESRTKIELLAEIEVLKNGLPSDNTDILKLAESQKKEIAELKEVIKQYENSTVLEDVKDTDRIELFSQEEYSVFEERLIQWRLQRQEIESTKVHFESLKDERDFIKGQLEYFKSSNDKILQQHQNLIEIIGQRNRIEAVEKGAIKKEPREI
jgi:DNA-binding transcriptional MerR regulator